MGRIVLIGGGARSGKSRFALDYATQLGERRLFVATARAHDDEMRERISRHREERGDAFMTSEEPIEVVTAVRDAGSADVVVVDCLTLWISNLLLQGASDEDVEGRVRELVQVIKKHDRIVLLVTNEVGLGIVPEHALARRFRDLTGRAHQQIATSADEVYLGAMGCILRLRPAPVATMDAPPWR